MQANKGEWLRRRLEHDKVINGSPVQLEHNTEGIQLLPLRFF
jgi:hypothetical protein